MDAGRWKWAGPMLLAAIVFVVFVRCWGPGMLVSGFGGDGQTQFLGWREQAFSRLAAGDIPLWNPAVFAGGPGVGNWQWAVFYPPNLLHLLLPTPTALTLLAAGHVFLAGLLTMLWLSRRGFGGTASFVGAVVFMLSGPYVARLFPGHFTWIAVAAYAPGLLLCLDRLLDTGRWRYAWLGAGVVALAALAGYPQALFILLLAGTVYGVLAGVFSPNRWRLWGGLGLMVLWGVAIAGVQAGPGVEAGLESVRAGGVPIEFAAGYALPVENVALLLAPGALGSLTQYRGQWNPWEVMPYFGAVALALALAGAVGYREPGRRWAVTMALLFGVLALGTATPLFRLAFEVVPGLGSFRVPGRFLLVTALFAAVLVAAGVQVLASARWAFPGAATALAALAATLALAAGPGSTLLPGYSPGPLLLSAGLLLLSAGLAVFLRQGPLRVGAIAGLVSLELGVVALGYARSSPADPPIPPALREALEATPPGKRIVIDTPMFANLPNRPGIGGLGLFGYDPMQSARWARFMAATQGIDPREVLEVAGPLRVSPAWRLLRAAVYYGPDGAVREIPDPLPLVYITNQVEVVRSPAILLARLMDPDFDPARITLLETMTRWPTPPTAPPDPGAVPSVSVAAAEPDVLLLDVAMPRLGMLVVTDAYAAGWRAFRLDSGEELEVVPANYVGRGVALPVGTYQLKLVYDPLGWRIGWPLTVIGLSAWLIAGGVVVRRGRARPITDGKVSTPPTA